MPSSRPTPWAVRCPQHGLVFLDGPEYDRQMRKPDSTWHCPIDGEHAWWSDDNYDAWMADQETYDAMVALHGDPDDPPKEPA